MGFRLDTDSRVATITVAFCRVVTERGLHRTSLRAIAAESRISVSTMLEHLDSRQRILGLVLGRLDEWRAQAVRSSRRSGPEAFLPVNDDELLLARGWVAILEECRSNEELAQYLHQREPYRALLLAQRLGPDWDATAVTAVAATLDGLEQAMVRGAHALGYDEASACLARVVDGLRPSRDAEAA